MNAPTFSEIVSPDTLRVGNGFQAAQLRHNRFDGLIDPIILVDHFALSAPQEPYPYAGLSALTYLFEDSHPARYVESARDLQDLCGMIGPGDLYWLRAGRGTLHGNNPAGDSMVHGLRVFVDLPDDRKLDAPAGHHVPAAAMRVIQRAGVHVRLVAGKSKTVATRVRLPQPFTMLDCRIAADIRFAHPMPNGWNALVYLIGGGPLTVRSVSKARQLEPGQAIAVGTRTGAASLVLSPIGLDAHAVVIAVPATAEAVALLEEEGVGFDVDHPWYDHSIPDWQ